MMPNHVPAEVVRVRDPKPESRSTASWLLISTGYRDTEVKGGRG